MGNKEFILQFVEKPEEYYLNNENNFAIGRNPTIMLENVVFYKINCITFEDKAPRKEALENVLSSMRIKGINFLYLIKGDKYGVSFYYGISRDLVQCVNIPCTIDELGDLILKPGIESNFRGSKISKLDEYEEQKILDDIANMSFIGNIKGVPGINNDDESYQGVDRLVDTMLGEEFTFLVTAKMLPDIVIKKIEKNLYNMYDSLAPLSKKNVQKGENYSETDVDTMVNGINTSSSEANQSGTTKNHGKTIQETRSSSKQYDNSETRTEGTNVTKNEGSYSENVSNTKTNTNGSSESKTIGKNITNGTSKNTGYEFTNKEVQDWLKYIDDVLLKRIDYGKGKGLFISTITLFTNKEASMLKLANTVTSLFSNDTGNKVALRKVSLAKNGQQQSLLRNLQIPIASFLQEISENEVYIRTALSQYVTRERAYLGNWFSVNELSIIAGLPQKEIVGLSLRAEVEFGLNYKAVDSNEKIEIGKLVQSGKMLETIVYLDKNVINKHIFVAGVTGSGKTTTCQKILINSQLPFLVIEPAKNEYRVLTETVNDILIFTLGKDKVAPFRLNPFEFYPHESITSHVDMIMASIESSFDMEAAIPQIIEKSIYECYCDYGWNIENDTNSHFSNDDIANGAYAFPTLSDLISKTEDIVKKQGFDIRLQNDYIGSIKARLQGLTLGAKGLMLNTRRSVDFRDLVHSKVIIELEDIRNGSEKALIMGFILSNLTEAIKTEYYRDDNFKHITLVEEAHRLLSKYEPGDSLNKKQGVEMFADMLAEVRKYGESLIIADQIPAKLTPEVLKNTNTKIVHKLFASDDKETMGNTMALSNEQKDFLSFLDTGRVIIFSQGWEKSLQVQVTRETDTSKKISLNNDLIRSKAIEYYCNNYRKGIYKSLKYFDGIPTEQDFVKHLNYEQYFRKLIEYYLKAFNSYVLSSTFKDIVCKLEEVLSIEKQACYIRDCVYYHDSNDRKLNAICSLLLDAKNDRKDISKYNNILSYGKRNNRSS